MNRYGQPIGILTKSRTRLGEKPDTIVGRKNADTGKYLSIGGCQAFNGLFNGSVNNIGQRGRTIVPVVWPANSIGLFRPKTAAKMVISV